MFGVGTLLSVSLLLSACGTEPTAADPLPERSLRTDLPPSGNFDLGHWKLTLPSGAEVSADELNAGFQIDGSFFTDPESGGMVFRCPNIAGHTDHSKYSRSELREMLLPQESATTPGNNWTTARGGVLKARLRVDAVSTTGESKKAGRVVIGQIHGPETEVVRLYFDKKPDESKGRLYVVTDQVRSGDGQFSADIVSNKDGLGISLGEIFEYQIELHQLDLQVTLIQQGAAPVIFLQRIDPDYEGLPLYFKAGLYNQNNGGDASDHAQLTFMALETSHPEE